MNGSSLLSLLLRRKRLLLLSGILTAILGFGISRLLPRSYVSEGTLIIENRANDTQGGQQSASAINNVTTQADVITSLGLVEKVVHSLNLVNDETLMPNSRLPKQVIEAYGDLKKWIKETRKLFEAAPIKDDTEMDSTLKYVQKHLGATSKDNSSVIKVTFEAGTPDTAARVTNAVMRTYLTTISATREEQIAKADRWIQEQTDIKKKEIWVAEEKVSAFVRTNHLAEVQGSLTAAIQLSKDQEELVKARTVLSRAQAAYDTVRKGSMDASTEALNLKSIQDYKAAQAKMIGEMNLLPVTDPRRASMEQGLRAINALITAETQKVLSSLAREMQIAQANVAGLETAIAEEMKMAQTSSVAGAGLKQLQGDVDAKRQALIAFLATIGGVRVAAEQAPTAHVLYDAKSPERPARSFGTISLVIGFIGGLAGCSGVILLAQIMRPKVNSTTDVSFVTGLQVYASLPDITRSRDHDMITETFRAMWLSMRPKEKLGVAVLVTSSEIGEGKSTVAMALAQRWASDDFRVLLIDADLRRPRLADSLKLKPRWTMNDVLEGSVNVEQAVNTLSNGLDCLLAKGKVRNPVKTLASQKFEDLLDECRATYDFVILDSPPVMHVADPTLLAKHCQHIVFVIQAGRLPNDVVQEATQRFDDSDREKMFTLLTRVPRGDLTASAYGGYSGRNG